MSNIAKLSDMYKQGTFKDRLGRETVSEVVYKNGVGTYDSDMEDFFNPIDRKYDKGGGGGGAKRINEAIDKVAKLLDGHPYHASKPKMFNKREIDVFGFSRGAAMARDFVNTFYTEIVRRHTKKYGDVRFNFIGIYDTVGSFGKPGNAINLKPKKEYMRNFDEDYLPKGMDLGDGDFGIRDAKGNIKIILGHAGSEKELASKISSLKKEGWQNIAVFVAGGYKGYTAYTIHGEKPSSEFFEPYNFDLAQGSAKQIYHLTAHHEVRKNFPLTDTRGAGRTNSLIGVHSDIGGGYAPNETEEFVYPGEYHTEQAALEQANKLAEALNAKSLLGGWVVADPAPVDYVLDGEMLVRMGQPHITLYRPKLEKTTSNALSAVGLYLMYNDALRYDVPLDAPKEKMPSYLKEYYTYSKKAGSSAYRYAQSAEGSKLLAGLSHHSARDPAHLHDNKSATASFYDKIVHDVPEAGNDARYVDKYGRQVDGRVHPEKAVKVERAIYHNNTDDAVLPKKTVE